MNNEIQINNNANLNINNIEQNNIENNANSSNNNQNSNHRNEENSSSILRTMYNNQTFIFKLFFAMNSIIFIANIFVKFNLMNLSICEWPILYLKQYYRLLTHHFFHLNFIHFFFNMLVFYFIGRTLEKKIGSMLFFIIIVKSIFLISIIYLAIIDLLKYILITNLKFKDYNYDFYSAVGFSGILFSIYEIICLFSSRAEIYRNVFSFLPIKSKNLPIFYLFCSQLINPNSSYIGHLSGIINGWIFKKILVFITLPNKSNISSFEKKYESYINWLEIKFNYIKISSIIQEEDFRDLQEFDRKFCDLYILKKISLFIKTNREVKETNKKVFLVDGIELNKVAKISQNNQIENVHRLDEEV